MVHNSNTILMSVTSVFPFDYFPTTINVETTRVTIIHRQLFASQVYSIDIKANIPKTSIVKYEDYIYTTQQLINTYYNNKGKTHNLQADPHIISCAKEEKIAVVTDELGGGITQIPYICELENIEPLSIVDFF